MQHLVGAIADSLSLDYQARCIQYSESCNFAEKGVVYSVEINSRSTFKKEFRFPDSTHCMVIGDIINPGAITDLVEDLNKGCPTDYYSLCKSRFIENNDKINGVFCVILINILHKKVFIISDPNGIIPIYYSCNSKVFIFSNSIQTILTVQNRKQHLNTHAIYELFKFGFSIPPDTLFEDVKALPPGDILEYNGSVIISKRSEKEFALCTMTLQEAADEYFRLFEQSLLKRVEHKKHVALLLSGGVDSAAIAAILHKHHIPVKCYTLDCNPDNPVEIIGAKKVCELLHLEHKTIDCIDGDIISCLYRVTMHNEAPVSNGVMEYALCEAIDKQTGVVLTGDGNDLIWGILPIQIEEMSKQPEYQFSNLYLRLRSHVSDQILEKLFLLPIDTHYLHTKINTFYNDTGNFLKDASDADAKLFGSSYAFSSVGKLKINPSQILFRFPYLDHHIESFIHNLPNSFKQYNHTHTPVIYKYLFKYALEQKKILPKEIIHTEKTWMYSPNALWLRENIKKEFEAIVFNPSAAICKYFNIDTLKEIWRLHSEQKQNFSHLLMLILQLEMWHYCQCAKDLHHWNPVFYSI